jgi:NAD(P)H-hydrate epimerase
LVTVAAIPEVCAAVSVSVPEATLLPLLETNGVVDPDSAQIVLDHRSRYQSALFGPGLTHEIPVLDFLSRVWREWDRPCVIDADALTAVSQGVSLPSSECVLTPHPGEMSRLLHTSTAEIQSDRFRTVSQAIDQFGQCVLLKGPYTIIGERGQPMVVNSSGNPGMASAGMGDVLGGIIATLLAQDLPPYYAASCGVYWHGMSGDICATEIGPIGYSAGDVSDALAKARCRIVSTCQRK